MYYYRKHGFKNLYDNHEIDVWMPKEANEAWRIDALKWDQLYDTPTDN